MVNVASSRLPVPQFEGRFFYCLLVNYHSRYLYLQTLRKGLKSQDRIFLLAFVIDFGVVLDF